MSAAQVLLELGDKPIAFHPVFARISGSVNAGVFMSQCLYWLRHVNRASRSFWKTQEEWTAETCLSRKQTETARRRWRELGVLSEDRRGLPAKLWFDIDLDRLAELVVAEQPSLPETGNLMRSSEQPSLSESNKHYREYESENTPESTRTKNHDRPAGLSASADGARLAQSSSDREFETWWAQWGAIPGAKRSKGQAKRAWQSARKKAESALLIRRASAYIGRCKADGTELRYIKHPATWLNGECWEDDLRKPPDPVDDGLITYASW